MRGEGGSSSSSRRSWWWLRGGSEMAVGRGPFRRESKSIRSLEKQKKMQKRCTCLVGGAASRAMSFHHDGNDKDYVPLTDFHLLLATPRPHT